MPIIAPTAHSGLGGALPVLQVARRLALRVRLAGLLRLLDLGRHGRVLGLRLARALVHLAGLHELVLRLVVATAGDVVAFALHLAALGLVSGCTHRSCLSEKGKRDGLPATPVPANCAMHRTTLIRWSTTWSTVRMRGGSGEGRRQAACPHDRRPA